MSINSKPNNTASHWLIQRISGALLAGLVIWMVYFIYHAQSKDIKSIIDILRNPINLIPFASLIFMSLYHGMLGMQTIIEDYVSNIPLRINLIRAFWVFIIINALIFAIALVKMIYLK